MNTIKRKARHVLSNTYYTKKTSIGLGGILMGMGLMVFLIIHYGPQDDMDMPPRIAQSLSFIFFLAGVFFIAPYYVFKSKIKNPLLYRPASIGLRNILGSVIGLLFVCAFLSIFWGIPGLKENKESFLIVQIFSVLFPLIFGFIVLREIFYTLRDMRFGESRLTTRVPLRFGEAVSATFSNDNLHKRIATLDVYLRNLKEYPMANRKNNRSKDKKVSSNSFLTEVLHEEQQSVALQGKTASFTIAIPESGNISDYRPNGSVYWEVEISQEDVGFYSRFLIEVES